MATPAPGTGPLEWTDIFPLLAGAARGEETVMCPVPGDDVTPSVATGPRPSHHSGPGYAANPKAPDFELDGPLREAAARWLNLVPAEHRHEGRESATDALATLREHTRSCPEHPLGALWVAHRHLGDPVPAVRIASLVLASEALWWLGHFEDARRAAQAAVDADPASAQALWRLAVALYRQGRFEEAGERLDELVKLASRFAPAWALRGQVKVWLDADNPQAGRADFAAAAALTSGSGTWVVPYRMAGGEFRAAVDAQIKVHDAETGRSSGEPVDVVLLPDKSRVERGVDPDRRWHLEGPSPGGGDSDTQFGGLGGDFAAGSRSRVPFGERFVLYQRNIENLCQDKATVREEIRRSVAELFDAALETHATIAVEGAPEQHAEGANIPGDEDR
jgi:tetratricopeptide (TPR) repeat protein